MDCGQKTTFFPVASLPHGRNSRREVGDAERKTVRICGCSCLSFRSLTAAVQPVPMNQTCFAALAALAFLPLPAVPAQSSPPVTPALQVYAGAKDALRDPAVIPISPNRRRRWRATEPECPVPAPDGEAADGAGTSGRRGAGTATLQMTLGPEPGFAGDEGSEPPQTRTLRVSARGQVLSPVTDAAEREMGEVFMLLPPGPVRVGRAPGRGGAGRRAGKRKGRAGGDHAGRAVHDRRSAGGGA